MKSKIVLALSVMLVAACGSTSDDKEKAYYQVSDYVTDGTFTSGIEGPAVDSRGHLYAVNLATQGTIGKVTGPNKTEIYLTLSNGSIGNGIRFDHAGNMYIADYVNHNILLVESGSKKVQVYAHHSDMNQPNDIAIADNGNLYASDPNWQQGTGNLWLINKQQDVVLLDENMGTTNGVEVSPGNDFLYVNESVQRIIWRYSILPDGTVADKQQFFTFDDYGMDGMRTDRQGNLYVARYGAGEIAIISPSGTLLKQVKLKGQHPTNVAFGGKEGKTVFVTMQKRGAIETFESEFIGRSFLQK